MVLEVAKHVRVKLEQLLGHAVQGYLAYFPCQFHLEKKYKNTNTLGHMLKKGHRTSEALSIT